MVRMDTVKNVVKFALVFLIFFFIVKVLYHNWCQLSEYSLHLDYSLLMLSMLVLIAAYLLLNSTWYFLTGKMGINSAYGGSTRNWFYSQLWKYLPGKVGVLFGRAYLYQKEGISLQRISLAVVVEAAMSLIAACVIALVSFAWVGRMKGERITPDSVVIVAGVIIGGIIVFLHPAVFERAINRVLTLMKRQRIKIEWRYLDSITILCCYTLNWFVVGVAFYLFVNSFISIPMSEIFFLTGSLAFASIVSFVSIFAPAGIGVREGILVLFLSRMMPESFSVILSITSRLWIVLTELIVVVLIKGIDMAISVKRKQILDIEREIDRE